MWNSGFESNDYFYFSNQVTTIAFRINYHIKTISLINKKLYLFNLVVDKGIVITLTSGW